MVLTISVAVLLGILVAVLMKTSALPIASGLVAALFGVFLGVSPAGAVVRELFMSLVRAANNAL